MKAWVLENQADIEDRPLEPKDVPEPQPMNGEIRIKVHACGVCRADIHIAEGDLPLKKSPLFLGHEIVGTVDKIGKNVRKFEIGDRARIAG